MRKLLNTLFVTSDDLYLSLENGNIEAWKGKEKAAQIPLINLENILDFSHKGASASRRMCQTGHWLLLPHAQWPVSGKGLRRGGR